jgi:hypothetical protein
MINIDANMPEGSKFLRFPTVIAQPSGAWWNYLFDPTLPFGFKSTNVVIANLRRVTCSVNPFLV